MVTNSVDVTKIKNLSTGLFKSQKVQKNSKRRSTYTFGPDPSCQDLSWFQVFYSCFCKFAYICQNRVQILENMVPYSKSNFLYKKIVGTKKEALPVTFRGLVKQCSRSESASPPGAGPPPSRSLAPFRLVPLCAACLQSPGPTGNPPTLMAFSCP